jgi:hypothetical protein
MDKTIDIAREAGDEAWKILIKQVMKYFPDEIERFVFLVRADEREIVMNEPLTKAQWQRFEDEIRADEREACAKEGWMAANSDCEDRVAAAIRARGETK